ncbi:MAG: HPr-rel-A system PqqD family peptide chaperone [Acidobacteriota bacterium]|nr:HPr-rel-A system PqqD family peptide chaperone [Acidobacteriota bacterium]
MIRRRSEVIWRPVDGRVVGLDLESSTYFSLNPSAAVLWERLADDALAGELAEVLEREFGLDADRARADVEAFLGELRAAGLLVES